MPRYRFTGWFETVLCGLSNDVNAVLHREGHGQPPGSTVVAQPGDEITTQEPFEHEQLAPVAEKPTKQTKPEPSTASVEENQAE